MIRENQTEKPFFLYLAFNAPHWSLQARPTDIAKQKGRYDAGWDVIRARRFERLKKLGIVDERWSGMIMYLPSLYIMFSSQTDRSSEWTSAFARIGAPFFVQTVTIRMVDRL